MADELIGIREAGRRLGVSDTAVHKAIKAGRVTLAAPTDSGRPRVAWPSVKAQWEANSDDSRRTHIGGKKPRAKVAEKPAEPAPAPQPAAAASQAQEPVGRTLAASAPSYAQSRAIRETYMAQLSKLEFEERKASLVDAASVRIEGYKLAGAVISTLYSIPDRLADELAGMSDPHAIHQLLLVEIDVAIEDLRAKYAGQY